MNISARAGAISVGVAGLSALYHLAREGWTDMVLTVRAAQLYIKPEEITS